MLRTRPITARAARRGADSSPTAPSRGSCAKTGRGRSRSSRRAARPRDLLALPAARRTDV